MQFVKKISVAFITEASDNIKRTGFMENKLRLRQKICKVDQLILLVTPEGSETDHPIRPEAKHKAEKFPF